MQIEQYRIDELNAELESSHKRNFDFHAATLTNVEAVIDKLIAFQVAIPSWALGAGGTRFGRFSIGGEPGNLE